MPSNSKDTIYIDIDDEITGVIDKVRDSKGKLVALVLPKRAATFQSIVNMKLLKRAADDSQKHLVLITSEAGLLPLAGAAGVHVAKTLNSKPEIPAAPEGLDEKEDAVHEAGELPEDVDAENAGDQPVGKLAGAAAAGAIAADGVETVELDNDDGTDGAADAAKKATAPAAAAKKAKDGKGKQGGKKFSIPNFGKFRTKLIIAGVALLALTLFIIFGLIVLPKATINIKTNASSVPVDLNLNLSTDAKTLDTDSSATPVVPAKLASEQKTYSQQVPATGQKNNGSKATGTVTMKARICGNVANAADVPAGTGLSANGQTFITQQSTSFSDNGQTSGGCITYSATGSTPIAAQTGGSSFNMPGGTSFNVAGRSDVNTTGSATGGTDNIVQIVNQNDINKARSQIAASNDSTAKQRLQNDLKKDNYYAITQTFNTGAPNVTQSARVGDVANSVTVTEVITYTMFGAKEKDLNAVVDSAVKTEIDTGKQSILSRGLDKAVFGVSGTSGTGAQLTLQTNAEVGPDLDIASLKAEARGKKPADVRAQIEGNPDVTSVDVKLSPFWVSSVPKKDSKIQIKIAEPTTAKSNSNANNP